MACETEAKSVGNGRVVTFVHLDGALTDEVKRGACLSFCPCHECPMLALNDNDNHRIDTSPHFPAFVVCL